MLPSKIKIQETIVATVNQLYPALQFNYFNNRRYIFELAVDNEISHLFILKVNMTKGSITAYTYSASIQHKPVYSEQTGYQFNTFLQNQEYKKYQYDLSITGLVICLQKIINQPKITATFLSQREEITLALKGIQITKNYPALPHTGDYNLQRFLYSPEALLISKNEKFKNLYIHLFNELKIVESGISKHRVKYLLLCIIQYFLTESNKQVDSKVYYF